MKNSQLKIFIFISALVFSISAWSQVYTFTLSQSNIVTSGTDKGKVVVSRPHVSFTLASEGYNITNGDNGGFLVWYLMPSKSTKNVTLTWALEDPSNYEIEVKSIKFKAKAYNSNVALVGQPKVSFNGGDFVAVGTATLNQSRGWSDYFGGEGAYTSGVTIQLKTGAYWPNTFDFHFKDFEIKYSVNPIIKTTENNSVEVTVCDDNRKYLDLASCVTNTLDHVSKYEYELYGDANPAGGHITADNKFYAENVGVYTVRIKALYKNDCHFTGYKTMNITVTPAKLTLTAPTASDIIYRQALSASTLTGGSAKVGGCVVDGTWAWKTSNTEPTEIGDDQPFPVVFTPTSAASNFTSFEANALVDVKRAQFIFDGSGNGADGDGQHIKWCKTDNWQDNVANILPELVDEVVVAHNVIIRQEVAAYSVTIRESDTLTIAPTGGLTVGAGGISIEEGGKLILKAGTEGDVKGQTGYLRISPDYTGVMPQATVEMFTIGYCDFELGLTNPAAWQYVGFPMQDKSVKAKSLFDGWIYNWVDSIGWKNNRKKLELEPFVGYATTQDYYEDGLLIEFNGQLVNNSSVDIPLTYNTKSPHPGYNALANSFTAPIDITRLSASDFASGTEATIHLFNTGTREQAESATKAPFDLKAKGQYISIPVDLAAKLKEEESYPSVIPAMQGFFVQADKADVLHIDYNKTVWGAPVNNNGPLRAKAQKYDASITASLRMSIEAEGWGDQLLILESEQFSAYFVNGEDAHKLMNGNLNIFAVEEEDQLSVDATESIIGTRVGVRTGEALSYTFNFGKVRSIVELALLDNETNQTIDINEGTEYTFYAEPNSMIVDRFQIVERDNAPAITTDIDNVENETKAHKFIKNNQLYILKNGVLYSATGAVVR